jgi:hypothetical protein
VTDQKSFHVEIDQSGRVCVSGPAAIHVLLRLTLHAKFGTEPNAEILLSPYVEALVDALSAALVAEQPTAFKTDWSNPANLTPAGFIRAAEVVRQSHAASDPQADLDSLIALALKPNVVPKERLAPAKTAPVGHVELDNLESLQEAAIYDTEQETVFLARCRRMLPEVIRLARLGLDAERNACA